MNGVMSRPVTDIEELDLFRQSLGDFDPLLLADSEIGDQGFVVFVERHNCEQLARAGGASPGMTTR